MSKFFIKFENRSVPIAGPLTIQELNNHVLNTFGIKLPGYSYLDEDSETIQVDIQLELNEAVRFLSETAGELIVEEKSTGSTLQFIEDLPLLRSQITIDGEEDNKKSCEKRKGIEEEKKEIEVSEVIQRIRSEASESNEEDSINEFEELNDLSVVQETKDVEIVKKVEEQEIKSDLWKTPIEKIITQELPSLNEIGLNKDIKAGKDIEIVSKDELIEDKESLNRNEEIKNHDYEEIKKEDVFVLDDTWNERKIEPETIFEEDFPDIEIEKEDISVDIEMIRSVIREELLVSRSGTHAIHNRSCSKCKIDPVVGPLYKCLKCYYFLCEACEENSTHLHSLLKIKVPEIYDRKIELIDRISKELNFDDKEKIKLALEKFNYDHDRAVNYILGLD